MQYLYHNYVENNLYIIIFIAKHQQSDKPEKIATDFTTNENTGTFVYEDNSDFWKKKKVENSKNSIIYKIM